MYCESFGSITEISGQVVRVGVNELENGLAKGKQTERGNSYGIVSDGPLGGHNGRAGVGSHDVVKGESDEGGLPSVVQSRSSEVGGEWPR